MAAKKRAPKSAYDQFKEFGGKRYTGMKVGRGHKWRYEQGDWSEKKVTPDKWEFEYSVKKHRAGRAPEGSGAPVGTAHHWYILAHQTVTKLDANSYSTAMTGLKYKVAHKRADKETWSAGEQRQRKVVIQILREMIAELEREPAEATAKKIEPAAPPAGTRTKRARPRSRARASAPKRPARRTATAKRRRAAG
jgi:hypothetical protein